jgi:hypothetical protein
MSRHACGLEWLFDRLFDLLSWQPFRPSRGRGLFTRRLAGGVWIIGSDGQALDTVMGAVHCTLGGHSGAVPSECQSMSKLSLLLEKN